MLDTTRFSTSSNLPALEGVEEGKEFGVTILKPRTTLVRRRVLYVNSYGGDEILTRIKLRELPSHHLWGCFDLVRMGYEVALLPALSDFYLWRRPLPHDLRLLRIARQWLGRDGIVYCGHNVLYWLPLLKSLGLFGARIVSLLFGREPLPFAKAHSGVIALNGAAAAHARMLAPSVPVAQLAWGVNLSEFPLLPFAPQWFLACGQTRRDHFTLARAAARTKRHIRVIAPKLPPNLNWPSNAELLSGGQRDDTVTYQELFYNHYAGCAASLIILRYDPEEATGVGFTNLIEAMAMQRPVIVTRTGALPSEIDVDQRGCGIHVKPNDEVALANAIETIAANPAVATSMGEAGRRLCESHYNIQRYARELDAFFERL